MEGLSARIDLPGEYDLQRTLWLAGMGRRDPTLRLSEDRAELAYVTPEGPSSLVATRREGCLDIECFGEGRLWALARLSSLFGLDDRPGDFQPTGKINTLARSMPGMHLPRLPVVFHRLIQVVLQQLVSWNDALASWIRLVDAFGDQAPGPVGLRMGPSPSRLCRLGYYELMACGVLPRQARLIVELARQAGRIQRLRDDSFDKLSGFLKAIPGIGDWTIQYLLGTSCGYADAVLTGDYSLPHAVAWYLAGKERSTDDEMIELLAPYQGHRFRVINLLWQAGIEAPRRGPKQRSQKWRFRQPSPDWCP